MGVSASWALGRRSDSVSTSVISVSRSSMSGVIVTEIGVSESVSPVFEAVTTSSSSASGVVVSSRSASVLSSGGTGMVASASGALLRLSSCAQAALQTSPPMTARASQAGPQNMGRRAPPWLRDSAVPYMV